MSRRRAEAATSIHGPSKSPLLSLATVGGKPNLDQFLGDDDNDDDNDDDVDDDNDDDDDDDDDDDNDDDRGGIKER